MDQLLPDEHTALYMENMDPGGSLQAAFGSGRTGPPGIPYIVAEDAKRVPVLVKQDDSDRGPYPLPRNPPIENGNLARLSVIDPNDCLLYEFLKLHKDSDGEWAAANAAVFDLRSHILRHTGFMSADNAGLPIFPGLVRFEEVISGQITHALRFTTPRFRSLAVWPARHAESKIYDAGYPPLGSRWRLKPTFRLNDFTPGVRVILRALQTYGMFLADGGPAWNLSGSPDKRWNDAQLAELQRVPSSEFEMLDETPLMTDANLGIARQDYRPGDLSTDAAPVAAPTRPKPDASPKQ